jgi:hypothetical protein
VLRVVLAARRIERHTRAPKDCLHFLSTSRRNVSDSRSDIRRISSRLVAFFEERVGTRSALTIRDRGRDGPSS